MICRHSNNRQDDTKLTAVYVLRLFVFHPAFNYTTRKLNFNAYGGANYSKFYIIF